MDDHALDRLRDSLEEQREKIQEWMETSTPEEKHVRLGPFNEAAIQQHLQVLDSAVAKADDKTLGRCEVCNDYIEVSRLEVDYTTKVCIDHFTDEQRRKLERELELSQKVQKALLPQQIPHVAGLELAAFSQPARIVGGDYFDFFQFQDGSPGFVIADVMGKGVAASLLMASLQASLRIIVTEEKDPCEAVRRLNQIFLHNINLTKFVTLFLGRYETDSRTLNYCNAGHNPPLFIRRNRNSWLQSTAPAIGLVENFQFKSAEVNLASGDLLLLYTDGVTEAHNDNEEEFGTDRLAQTASSNLALSARDVVTSVRRAIQEFTKQQPVEDDTTILAIRVE